MIECNISNLSKQFGNELIFEHITFDVKTKERVGLVGPNGIGKTTLLKILVGQETQTTGDVFYRKEAKVGYLEQIPVYDDNQLVIDILKSAFSDVFSIKHKIDEITLKMGNASGDELNRYLQQYEQFTFKYEQLDGYHVETNISKVTTGLKITDAMLYMNFNVLSGGEKTRVMLGKILLESPSILLLDEPSNHLDLESIEWLESYLKEYDGSIVVVSHDRYFLDNVCTKIVELSLNKAYLYHGNYSYYVIEKERRFLLEMKVYLAQEKKIKRMEDQIKQYRIWGEMRDSDKMFKRAKELERRLEKIERLDKPKKDSPKIKIKKIETKRSGKRALDAKHLDISYDELTLLKNVHMEIIYQDRLAILGNNGTGKTSLIKHLIDDYHKGEQAHYKWGSKVKLGYLPQEVVFEHDEMTVIEYFTSLFRIADNDARRELAKALFIRDDVFKKISSLSGGEKSKLLICQLNYMNVNLMVLDEPTNHLDIDSREILEELLLEFSGTILFVSHDRYFIKKIATRIGEIENQELHYYEGDYEYYKYLKHKQPNVVQKNLPIKDKKKISSNNNETDKIIKQIELLDEEIQHIDQLMETHPYDAQKLNELYNKKESLLKEYEVLMEDLND